MADCSVAGCCKAIVARGLCRAHYQRWWKHGDPIAGGTAKKAAVSFLRDVVMLYAGDECLTWPYAKNSDGYAIIRRDGRTHRVSRIVCEEKNGPPPTPNHEAAHCCGKGHEGCVSGSHLSWKTAQENAQDKIGHGTTTRGERNGRAALTADDILSIRAAIKAGSSHADLAQAFGVSRPNISQIKAGTRWSWLEDAK